MTSTIRKERDRLKIKEAIFEIAIKLASEKGWSDVSIRKISARIHYSTIKIYSVFGSKENLFIELREQGFKKLYNLYHSLTINENEPKQAIRDITRKTIEFYLNNKELYQIMFGVVGITGVKKTCREDTQSYSVAHFIKKILENALPGNSDSLFFNWWALVHGFISIGMGMGEQDFMNMLSYLDDSIERFVE